MVQQFLFPGKRNEREQFDVPIDDGQISARLQASEAVMNKNVRLARACPAREIPHLLLQHLNVWRERQKRGGVGSKNVFFLCMYNMCCE